MTMTIERKIKKMNRIKKAERLANPNRTTAEIRRQHREAYKAEKAAKHRRDVFKKCLAFSEEMDTKKAN